MKTMRKIDGEIACKVRARRESGATYAQIKAEFHVGASTISRILGTYGSGPRPRIPAAVRSRALALRRDGRSVPEIARELGIARSTAWTITKEVSWTPGPNSAARRAEAGRAYWRRENVRRAEQRERTVGQAASKIGPLSERELLLIGAVLYWAEGSKMKPWNRSERLRFINSDPDVIVLYLRWLKLIGVADERVTFRVHIHESADVRAAEQYWASLVGVGVADLETTTLKRHTPKTVRKNTGADYRGCLIVTVRSSSAEYRVMDGVWRGICSAVRPCGNLG